MNVSIKAAASRLAAVITACAVAVAALLALSDSPAHAHTRDSAITNGCGSGYAYVSGTLLPVVSTTSSTVYGYVGLARASVSRYCVFAYKSAGHSGHGVATFMEACYVLEQGGDCDSGRFSHWAAEHFTLGFRERVYYGAVIHHPTPGYLASARSDWYTRPDAF